MNYKYYDTPDGQDCYKKLFYTTKKAGIFGIGVSSTYIILCNTPKTYPKIFARYALITAPFIATAVAGTITICTATNARQEDSPVNHLLGGFIGGIAGGLAKGNFGHGVAAGLVLGIVAGMVKAAHVSDFNIMPLDTKYNVDDHWSVDYDLRITKPRPKNWIAE